MILTSCPLCMTARLSQDSACIPCRTSGEAADGGGVGLAGVRVPDVGGEELEDALGGGRVGREEGGELDTAARESFRCWGCGLGNQCRVVGHDDLLNICMIKDIIIHIVGAKPKGNLSAIPGRLEPQPRALSPAGPGVHPSSVFSSSRVTPMPNSTSAPCTTLARVCRVQKSRTAIQGEHY